MTHDWQGVLQLGFIGYFVALNGGYLLLGILSIRGLQRHSGDRSGIDDGATYLGIEPPISLLVPAYNEEATIRTSIRSMLQLEYPDFELVVINDGSPDRTMDVLVREFGLVPYPGAVRIALPHASVRGIYRSTRHPNLRVIDKDNGGKADALNAGINLARHGLFCAVDADSILQRDSLLRLVRPFLDDGRTVAAGGTVRIANGSRVRGGYLEQAGIPRNWLARFQIVEYLRAFLFGRLGWTSMNAVLIISGAFGLFDRRRVVDAGGYRHDTIGEDMELVVRLHRYHRERSIPYRITYVPDPVCWTEAPEDIGTLGRQRSRWQRGLSESLALQGDAGHLVGARHDGDARVVHQAGELDELRERAVVQRARCVVGDVQFRGAAAALDARRQVGRDRCDDRREFAVSLVQELESRQRRVDDDIAFGQQRDEVADLR